MLFKLFLKKRKIIAQKFSSVKYILYICIIIKTTILNNKNMENLTQQEVQVGILKDLDYNIKEIPYLSDTVYIKNNLQTFEEYKKNNYNYFFNKENDNAKINASGIKNDDYSYFYSPYGNISYVENKYPMHNEWSCSFGIADDVDEYYCNLYELLFKGEQDAIVFLDNFNKKYGTKIQFRNFESSLVDSLYEGVIYIEKSDNNVNYFNEIVRFSHYIFVLTAIILGENIDIDIKILNEYPEFKEGEILKMINDAKIRLK